jgi:hypothetical protein
LRWKKPRKVFFPGGSAVKERLLAPDMMGGRR